MKRVSLRFAVLMAARSIAALVLARSRRQECKIVPFGCNYFAFSATNRIKGFS